jgi:hypothetical protein
MAPLVGFELVLIGRSGEQGDWTQEFKERHTSRYRLTDKGRVQAEIAGKWVSLSTHIYGQICDFGFLKSSKKKKFLTSSTPPLTLHL